MSSESELAAYVARWREVGPLLEAMRDRALVETPVSDAMDQLSGMVESAIHLEPLRDTSGLVEMQRILSRLRE